MKFRNLEKIRTIIKDATGLDLTYAYDDLVFPEHVAFLVQFDDNKEDHFLCHFHEDCIRNEKKKIFKDLERVSKVNKCTIEKKGTYTLKQKGEEFEVHFINP